MPTSENIRPGDWVNAVRTMRFGTRRGVRAATIRAVALTLASYADYLAGDDVRPGVAMLAVHSEVDYRTARTVMAILRDDLGLIALVRGGRRRGLADEYRLTMPDDIVDRIEVLNPAQVALAVEQIRGKHRRKEPDGTGVIDARTTARAGRLTLSGTGVVGTRTGVAQPVDNPAVRVSPGPVPSHSAEIGTGVAGPPSQVGTGAALPPGTGAALPPHRHRTDTPVRPTQPQRDIRTEVTVDGGSDQDPDSQDRESTPAWDRPTPPPTRAGRAVGRARVPDNVVPLRPRTA